MKTSFCADSLASIRLKHPEPHIPTIPFDTVTFLTGVDNKTTQALTNVIRKHSGNKCDKTTGQTMFQNIFSLIFFFFESFRMKLIQFFHLFCKVD